MDYTIKGETLEGIADAIRQKTGKTEKMLPTNFADEIAAMSGGDEGGGGSTGGGGGVSITVDDALSETSTNPVQNRAIAAALNQKQGKLTAGDGIILKENTLQAYGVYRGDYNVAKSYETNDIIYWQGGGSAKAGYRVFITRMAGEDELRQQTPGVVLDSVTEIESKTREFAGSIVVDDYLSEYSTNPVQNKVIALAQQNAISSVRSEIRQDYLKKSDAEKQYVPYAEYRKAYIDVNDYLSDGVMNNTTFNAKLAELASQSKGGQDRVDVYFYNTGTKAVIFDNLIVWQSNCNYHYLLASDHRGGSVNLSLNNIKNCRFYGFYVYAVTEGYVLNMQSCENIEFYDCVFNNPYKTAITIENCKSIYFNDCYIKGGNYPSQQVVCYIADSSTARRWIIFENCEIEQGTEASSVPLFACGNVSNANAVLFVLHCITNSNNDISASSFSKGSGKIRISALTSV